MSHHCRGLTLVELLVAIAVFTVIGLAAHAGLSSVLESRQHSERQAARLAEVQYAVDTLAADLRQAVSRPVRSDLRASGHALAGDEALDEFLLLTRTGWPNPAGLRHASLARVSWRLEDGRLLRAWRMYPDATLATPETRRRVLTEVESVHLRFLDADGEWQSHWPERGLLEASPHLPRAIEVTLVLADWGPITRLLEPPAGVP